MMMICSSHQPRLCGCLLHPQGGRKPHEAEAESHAARGKGERNRHITVRIYFTTKDLCTALGSPLCPPVLSVAPAGSHPRAVCNTRNDQPLLASHEHFSILQLFGGSPTGLPGESEGVLSPHPLGSKARQLACSPLPAMSQYPSAHSPQLHQ